ncbi:MAG: DUF6382 domain-containing protein [Ruminococcus sp.]|jgi:hypothetical protein
MISFSYEEQAGKKYLVYEKKEEDALDLFTLEMIRNNKIKGLAPFTCIQIDGRMLMKYEVTELISIKEYLSGMISRQKLLNILEKISDVLAEAEEYFLEISSYVFEENYIYVSPKTSQIVMIVLPVGCERKSKESFENFLKKLLLNIQYDQKEDCSYVVGLINFLSGTENFSVYKFREQIEAFKKQELKTPPEPSDLAYTIEKDKKEREKADIWESDITNTGTISPVPEENKNEAVKKSFLKKLFGKKEEKEGKKIPFSGMEIPGKDNLTNERKEENVSKEQLVIPEQKMVLDEKKVEQRDFGETVFVDEGTAETFFLDKNQEKVKRKFLLRRCATDENYEISGEKTRIGRNPAGSEICISGNRGIGRIHAVFYISDGNVYIADNNSKNKTFVCGTQLKYGEKPRMLHSGDKIQLGDEEFEFYIQ